ncbi:MAG: type II toxin-antitoxin system RelE family toxin [Thiotrichales bacterium]
MSYELEFVKPALKEWNKLDAMVKAQFKKKLAERLESPGAEHSRLSGMKDCYKIKLAKAGYRLVYKVEDEQIIVLVLSVGKREGNAVYKAAMKRV